MGLLNLFTKKPNNDDLFWINRELEQLNYYNDMVLRCNSIPSFLYSINDLKKVLINLLKYEKKYPYFFNPKPSEILKNFRENNKLILEQNFVDRYIVEIERKLLNYSTMRGKLNNFNKMADCFRFEAGEFEPETVRYFEVELSKNFPDLYFNNSKNNPD